MSIRSRGILIAVCVLLGALCLLGAGPNAPASAGSGGESPVGAALESESVLVEAFVVEVNLPALSELGVSPIGRQPHAMTVADLLQCLDNGQARVIGGEKIATQPNGGKMEVQTKKTTYIKRETPRSPVSYTPFASGKELTITVRPVTETVLSVGFAFESSRFAEKQGGTEAPRETDSWSCSGSAILDLGESQIVGSRQNDEIAVFLLLVANARK